MTFVVVGAEEVKKLAHEFIVVIPDDLEDYKSDIDGWDGSTTLEFSHADDDIFVFIAAPLKEGTPARFGEFVEEFRHPDSDDETDSDDGSDDDESDDELGAKVATVSLGYNHGPNLPLPKVTDSACRISRCWLRTNRCALRRSYRGRPRWLPNPTRES